MNKRTSLLLLLVLLAGLACKKEYSYEKPAVSKGFLNQDAFGNCDTMIASGNFTETHPLNDTNTLTVTVHVNKAGSYIITSDSANGYSFGASGNFGEPGTFQVKLNGRGTPLVRGTDHLNIYYDSSVCVATIVIAKDLTTPANFVLAGAPVDCMDPVLRGNYIREVGLNEDNSVSVTLLVTEPGTYQVSTNTVNGYGFSGSGTVAQTGRQVIILHATGTPLSPGTDQFQVTAGSSVCSFIVDVLTPVIVADRDHFPLTEGSYWVYRHSSYRNDSIVNVVQGSAVFNDLPYVIVHQLFPARQPTDLYYRRTGSDFFQYGSPDRFTETFGYTGVTAEIPFLKEGLVPGAQWISPLYTGHSGFGQNINLQYRFYCLDADGSAVANGLAFIHVYRIRMDVYISGDNAAVGPTGESYEFDYAKGVGLVLAKKTNQQGQGYQQTLMRWLVN